MLFGSIWPGNLELMILMSRNIDSTVSFLSVVPKRANDATELVSAATISGLV